MFDRRMLKQAQELQSKLNKLQEELGKMAVEGTAGGGAVTVVMNGHQEIQSVKIQKDVVSQDDVGMLEDLVLAAVRDASKQARELAARHLGSVTGGMKIPGVT